MLETPRRRITEGGSDEGRHSEREKAPELERSPAHFCRRGVVDGHASYASATLQAPDRRRVVGSVFGTAGRIWVNTTDRKSTRLNSSHANISYAVFCLKKKLIFFMNFTLSFSLRTGS